MRDRARRPRRARRPAAGDRQLAGADREPVQARATGPSRSCSRPERRPTRSAGGSSRRSVSTRTSSASARSRRTCESSRPRSRSCAAIRRPAASSSGSAAIAAPGRKSKRAATRSARGGGKRGERGERGERSVAEAEPGRLVLVRRGGAPTLAMVLGIHAIRGHRVLIDALLPHGATVRVKSGVIKRVFWATPPLHVPRDRGRDGRDRASDGRERSGSWRDQQRDDRDGRDRRGPDGRGLRHLAVELERLSVPELIDRERAQGPEAALPRSSATVARGARPPAATASGGSSETVTERLGVRRRQLEALRGAYWQEFTPCRGSPGAVRRGARSAGPGKGPAHRRDSPRQRAARRRGRVARRVQRRLRPGGGGRLLGADRGGAVRRPGAGAHVHEKAAQAQAQARSCSCGSPTPVHEAQRARHLRIPIAVHSGFMPAVYRWASGEDDWSAIVEEAFGGHEGDPDPGDAAADRPAPSAGRQSEVPAETARVMTHASRVIDRGIVLESALI